MARIYVFSIMHNEEVLLPYFLRHYETFADKIFIINAHSTDKTEAIIRAHPKAVMLYCPYNTPFTEADVSKCYKDNYIRFARGLADWAMCVDGDEFIYSEDIQGALSRAKNADAIRTTCYTMVSDHLPISDGQIYNELGMGVRTDAHDKPIIFKPDKDIEFAPGRHTIENLSEIRITRAKIKLLHYRYLSRDYAIERTDRLFSRINETDRVKNYLKKRSLAWYDNAMKVAEQII